MALRAHIARVEPALAISAKLARVGKLPSGSRATTMSTFFFFFFFFFLRMLGILRKKTRAVKSFPRFADWAPTCQAGTVCHMCKDGKSDVKTSLVW
jgi:hypothetical protein